MADKVVTVIGARPQFIKAAAVSRAFRHQSNIEEILIHTGQHFDGAMSDIFFQELDLPAPKYNLGIAGQSHAAMTGRMMEAIETILIDEKPDICMVYGDTNSTLAGALAAAKLHVPIAHVEAGLRSFNRRMPEEINRVVTDHLAAVQFCPTQASIENLRREGISSHVHHTGDVMFDATQFAIAAIADKQDVLKRFGIRAGEYNICTIHRAENTDDPARLSAVVDYLRTTTSELPLVLPLHPRTRSALQKHGLNMDFAIVTEPLGYFELNMLLAGTVMVYTDSGGLQKEAYFHGKPCVTLRDETEWVETINHGWNRLWQGADYVTPRQPITDYGTGNAADKIAQIMADF